MTWSKAISIGTLGGMFLLQNAEKVTSINKATGLVFLAIAFTLSLGYWVRDAVDSWDF